MLVSITGHGMERDPTERAPNAHRLVFFSLANFSHHAQLIISINIFHSGSQRLGCDLWVLRLKINVIHYNYEAKNINLNFI